MSALCQEKVEKIISDTMGEGVAVGLLVFVSFFSLTGECAVIRV